MSANFSARAKMKQDENQQLVYWRIDFFTVGFLGLHSKHSLRVLLLSVVGVLEPVILKIEPCVHLNKLKFPRKN